MTPLESFRGASADERDSLALALAEIASLAAVDVMSIYEGDIAVAAKSDQSPVTEADRRAEAIIEAELRQQFPGVPIVAEEACAEHGPPACGDCYFLVDPVDGTKEFIRRNGEFTVNIALIENGIPAAGCVFAPALERIYLGGTGARAGTVHAGDTVRHADLKPIATRAYPDGGLAAVASRSHLCDATKAFLAAHRISETVNAGSSLKFCFVAEGRADVYPRFGPTMEWDVAAGHAVLAAAGGHVLTPDGEAFTYGKQAQGYRNGPFVAWGNSAAI